MIKRYGTIKIGAARRAESTAAAAKSPPLLLEEDEIDFVRRRLDEERRLVGTSSCIVRSVHEELLETYEERLADDARAAADLEAVLNGIGA